VASSARPMLIFDGDCAFCTRSATWLERRLRSDVIVLPWQRADLAGLSVSAERARREVLWVGPAGAVSGGASAVAAALKYCGAAGLRAAGLALSASPLRWVAPAAYRLAARNRYRLPGGTSACATGRDQRRAGR
jgi:predicted DCC family thiol-disulfide oxidoreductase YuxK